MTIDQAKLEEEFIFTGRGTVAELVSEMDRIARLKKKYKSRVSLIRWLALALPIVAILGGGGWFVLALMAAIGLLFYSFAAGPKIVDDRVEFLRLTLKTIGQDCGQRDRFQVSLGLRPKREKIAEGPNPHHKGGKQLHFRDPWCSVAGCLGDGTSLSVSCIDLIRRRTRRNPRGKTKTKERLTCLMRVQLDYNSAKYGDAASIAAHLQNPFLLPKGVQMKAFTFTGSVLAMKAMVTDTTAAAALHAAEEAMFLGAYRILHLARRRTIASGGAR